MNIEKKRLTIIFLIILNFALYISFSNFLTLEKGICDVQNTKYTPLIVDLKRIAENGKGKGFFVENYNSAYGDGSNYMLMAIGKNSYPPYSLRPFYPKFIGSITGIIASVIDKKNTKATQLNLLQPVMSIFNSLFLGIATVFLFFSIKKYLNDELLSALLSIGLIVNIGVIQTSQFFMLDVISYCIGALAIYFFTYRRYLYLSVTIGLGILFKEVIIIYSLLLLYPFVLDKPKWTYSLKLLMVPISVFIGLRLFMNVDPLSMQYGWNISQGDVKLDYLMIHLGSIKHIMLFGIQILFTFGFLWFFVASSLMSQQKKLILILFLMIGAIIFADALLASRVPRVIFVMFPAIAILSAIGINQILKKNDAISL